MRHGKYNKVLLLLKFTHPVLYLLGAFHQIGDRNGELTARMNVEQLMEALGVSESDLSPSSSEFEMQGDFSLSYFLHTKYSVIKVIVKYCHATGVFSCLISIFNAKFSDNGYSFKRNIRFLNVRGCYSHSLCLAEGM